MRATILIVGAIFLLLTATGCEQQSSVAEGAMPPMFTPVGPVPGLGNPPAAPTNPYAHDEVAMTLGRKLFLQYNCAGCHGGHGGGGMGPSLRDSVWIYGDTDANIFNSIAEGRGKGMPAWGLKVPEVQIWQLVAYLKSMRSPREPEKPE